MPLLLLLLLPQLLLPSMLLQLTSHNRCCGLLVQLRLLVAPLSLT
jgi:hypothetical protein